MKTRYPDGDSYDDDMVRRSNDVIVGRSPERKEEKSKTPPAFCKKYLTGPQKNLINELLNSSSKTIYQGSDDRYYISPFGRHAHSRLTVRALLEYGILREWGEHASGLIYTLEEDPLLSQHLVMRSMPMDIECLLGEKSGT